MFLCDFDLTWEYRNRYWGFTWGCKFRCFLHVLGVHWNRHSFTLAPFYMRLQIPMSSARAPLITTWVSIGTVQSTCCCSRAWTGDIVRYISHLNFDIFPIYTLIYFTFILWYISHLYFDIFHIFTMIYFTFILWYISHLYFDIFHISSLIYFTFIFWYISRKSNIFAYLLLLILISWMPVHHSINVTSLSQRAKLLWILGKIWIHPLLK